MDTAKDTVIRIVAGIAGCAPGEITEDSRLAEDLHVKSANRIEMSVLVTDELGVELTMFDVLKAKTVGDVIALVRAHEGAPAS